MKNNTMEYYVRVNTFCASRSTEILKLEIFGPPVQSISGHVLNLLRSYPKKLANNNTTHS